MAVREAGALLALGALGGLWAVAWGQRRAHHADRIAMLDARTQIHVRIDALRARTATLARKDLPSEARRLVDLVVEQEVLIHAVLSRAATAQDIRDVDAEIADAFINVEEAAELAGEHMPAGDPFAGLCRIDPAHGPTAGPAGQGGRELMACADCVAAAADGRLPPRRLVTTGGRPVEFDLPVSARGVTPWPEA